MYEVKAGGKTTARTNWILEMMNYAGAALLVLSGNKSRLRFLDTVWTKDIYSFRWTYHDWPKTVSPIPCSAKNRTRESNGKGD